MPIDGTDLKAAARWHSKALAGLGIAVIVISIYVLQRSAAVLNAVIDPNNLGQSQVVQSGLDFSYYTLSITWPIILGVICLMFRTVAGRRNEVLALLSENGFSRELIDLEDPLYLQLEPGLVSRAAVTAGAILPAIAIIASTYAVVRISGISLVGGIQVISGLAGLALTGGFVAAIQTRFLRERSVAPMNVASHHKNI